MKFKLNFAVLLYFTDICLSLYSNVTHVVELTPKNFDNLVVKSDEVWVVQFYAPWCTFCQNFVPEFTKLANVFRGIIKVGAVNADEHRELAGIYNVRNLPALKIFGVDKQKPEDYAEGKNAEEIMNAVLTAAKAKIVSRFDMKEQQKFRKETDDEYVVQLTDENFNELVLSSDEIWMIEFYAPWCGYCRNLEPHWKKAAKELQGKIKFGAIDGSIYRSKLATYNIKGYPSIILFIPGLPPINYDGERSSSGIVSWALQQYETTLRTPEVLEIVNEQVVVNECDGKQWAIITFLPDIAECGSICRKSYLKTLNWLAENLKKKYWCWLWSEANAQPEIQRILRVGGSGYPVLVAVNYKIRSYVTFTGPFVKEQIYKFLVKVNDDTMIKLPIASEIVPEIFSVEPWDGQDVLIPQFEEKDEL